MTTSNTRKAQHSQAREMSSSLTNVIKDIGEAFLQYSKTQTQRH